MKRIYRIVMLVCVMTTPAYGTLMYYLEVEDLARLSSDIFKGRVMSATTYWNEGRTRIYTSIRVQIDDPYKGRTRQSQVVTITQLGGELDGVKMDYAGRPTFDEGEEVLLFTTRGKRDDYVVMALKQGKMRVEGREAVREFSGITFVERGVTGSRTPLPAGRSLRLPLNEVRMRVARVRQ